MANTGLFNHTLLPSFFANAFGNIWLPPFKRLTSVGKTGTPLNLKMAAYHRANNADSPSPPRKPNAVLEMGTSLGVTTCYLAQAMPHVKLVTMEGAPEVAKLAQSTFQHLGYSNIQLMVGNFNQSLPLYLNEIDQVGLVFIDGNHSYAPTMDYFNQLLSKSNHDSIFIFDDIHWSVEMENAWEAIKKEERVSLTIDLFYIGIVFLKKENKEKENFIIRF